MKNGKNMIKSNHRSKIMAERAAFAIFRVLSGVIVTVLFIILGFIISQGSRSDKLGLHHHPAV